MDHFSRLLKFHRHRLIINYFDDNYRSGKQFSSIHPGIAKTFLKTHGGVQKALNRLWINYRWWVCRFHYFALSREINFIYRSVLSTLNETSTLFGCSLGKLLRELWSLRVKLLEGKTRLKWKFINMLGRFSCFLISV